MSDNLDQVFTIINNATKQGKITPEEKQSIKEMLLDENPIVMEYVEDFMSSKNEEVLLSKIKDYIKLCESDDEDEKQRKQLEQLGSPDGDRLYSIKKKREGGKKENEDFADIEECEQGLSPKVVFDKK